ncbi:MAG: thioesterase family protein, partial [Pseudomonadota bacterium]|nr:thioesterase family protein [Pseudomonadota bacterium]
NRDMQLQAHYPRRDDIPQPEEIPNLAWDDRVPIFMKHFEARAIKLSLPMSGSAEADNLIWFRHKDSNARDGIVPLIALGDAPPPAVLGMLKTVRGISSMNWNINMLVDAPQTRDGWWLLNTFSQHAGDGYASQIMNVWDADGTRIMDAMQMIAAFE